MKPSDFTGLSPGKLIPTSQGAVAFVPGPIPRTLGLDAQTVLLLARAENALGRLTGTTARLVNPYLVGSPLLHREAILSSRIEGTVTSPEDLVLLEASGKAGAWLKSGLEDTREVLNYVKAMKYGLRRLKQLPVCLRLIRELHGELLRGVRGDQERPGEFRTSQNWIARPGDPITLARFVPPPAAEMMSCLDDFERFLNEDEDELPLLVRLALVHYQFETIHPFRDGNGRIGRLLMPLLLCSREKLDEPLLYLSSYFERNKETYMDLLLRVSQKGDWLDWVKFFLRAVCKCSEEAIEQADGLINLRQEYQERFRSARSPALLQKLIDSLFRSPSITIGQAVELLNVTPAAAAHNIHKLEAAGILTERTGRKRDQIFVAKGVLAFLDYKRGKHPATKTQGE